MKLIVKKIISASPLKKTSFILTMLFSCIFIITIFYNGFYYAQPPTSGTYFTSDNDAKETPTLYFENWYCADMNEKNEVELEIYASKARAYLLKDKLDDLKKINDADKNDPRNIYKYTITKLQNAKIIFYYEDIKTKEKKRVKITGRTGYFNSAENIAYLKNRVIIEQSDEARISTDEVVFFISSGILNIKSEFSLSKKDSVLRGSSLSVDLNNEKYVVQGPMELKIFGSISKITDKHHPSKAEQPEINNEYTNLKSEGKTTLENVFFAKNPDDSDVNHYVINSSDNVVLNSKTKDDEMLLKCQFLNLLFEQIAKTDGTITRKIIYLNANNKRKEQVFLSTKDSEVIADEIFYKVENENSEIAGFKGNNIKAVIKNFGKTSFLGIKKNDIDKKQNLNIFTSNEFNVFKKGNIVTLDFPNKSIAKNENFELSADSLNIEMLTDKKETSKIKALKNVQLVEDKLYASADEFYWDSKNGYLTLKSQELSAIKSEDFHTYAKEISYNQEKRLFELDYNCLTTITAKSNSGLNKSFVIFDSLTTSPNEDAKNVSIKSETQKITLCKDSNSLEKVKADKNVSFETKSYRIESDSFYWNEFEKSGTFSTKSIVKISSDNSHIECNYVFLNAFNSKIDITGLKFMKLSVERKKVNETDKTSFEEIKILSKGTLTLQEALVKLYGRSVLIKEDNVISANNISLRFTKEDNKTFLQNLFAKDNVFIKGKNSNASGDFVNWDYTKDEVIIRGLPYAQMFTQDNYVDNYILAGEIRMKSDWSSYKTIPSPKWPRVEILQVEKKEK